METERLLRLADFLEFDPRPQRRFDFGTWVGKDWLGRTDLSCGTTACALGWATQIPEFREAGLILAPSIYKNEPQFDGGMVILLPWLPDDARDNFTGSLIAAERFFGLSKKEARYLFLPDENPPDCWPLGPSPTNRASAERVAEHIREFVEAVGGN